jgi:hypothetical protein
LLTALLACNRQAEIILPPDEELVSLIHDLHLAEASMARVHISMQDSVSMALRERIALAHGITPEQMDTWLETLQTSPDHLLIVYDSVIARLEREVPGR